jgi:hypothetical protein
MTGDVQITSPAGCSGCSGVSAATAPTRWPPEADALVR